MKRLLPLLALGASLTASADVKPGFASVEITTQRGEVSTVTLTDAMTTRFTASDVIFADATTTVSLPLAQLRSYSFVPAVVPEGIVAPRFDTTDGQPYEVYSLDGRRLTTASSLSLEGLTPGTYVVRHGNTTLKVHHRP